MYIVAVMECIVDEPASLCFIDTDKLDPENKVHSAYLKGLENAREDKIIVFKPCNMVMRDNKEIKEAVVELPILVSETLELWGGF